MERDDLMGILMEALDRDDIAGFGPMDSEPNVIVVVPRDGNIFFVKVEESE